MKNKKVCIIVVTFNPQIENFENNLQMFLENDSYKIILVDNFSNNIKQIRQSVILNKEYIILNELDSNYGIAHAQNKGINIAKNLDCTHVLFFDQDSCVPSNTLQELLSQELKILSQGINLGAIGPIYKDSRTNNFYPLGLIKGINLKKIYPEVNSNLNYETSFIISSGTLIQINIFDKVGLMNTNLFIDIVDIEWCLRASHFGYKIFATSSVILNHSIGDKRIISFGKEISIHSPIRRYYMVRNALLITRFKWVPLGYKLRIIFGTILRSLRFIYALNFNFIYIKHIVWGLRDGLFNISGKFNKL